MRESCLIRLRPAPLSDENAETAAVSWLSSGLAARHGTLGEAAADAQGRRIVVVVPGQDVLLTAAVVPSRNRQRIVEALPYILEDQLASDVDELHFAVGARVRDGTVPAAVVAHERMAHWLAQLRSVGIDPDELVRRAGLGRRRLHLPHRLSNVREQSRLRRPPAAPVAQRVT